MCARGASGAGSWLSADGGVGGGCGWAQGRKAVTFFFFLSFLLSVGGGGCGGVCFVIFSSEKQHPVLYKKINVKYKKSLNHW